MENVFSTVLTPVREYPQVLETMDKKLALGINSGAYSSLKKECKGYQHFDNKVIAMCLESGRVVECLEYALSVIKYKLQIVGNLLLDISPSKQLCDIKRFDLKAISLLECSGASKLSEIAHQSKWALPTTILSVLALNPSLATCFDSSIPVLALNKGWNTHKSIPILYADNVNKIIFITRGFPSHEATGCVSMFIQ